MGLYLSNQKDAAVPKIIKLWRFHVLGWGQQAWEKPWWWGYQSILFIQCSHLQSLALSTGTHAHVEQACASSSWNTKKFSSWISKVYQIFGPVWRMLRLKVKITFNTLFWMQSIGSWILTFGLQPHTVVSSQTQVYCFYSDLKQIIKYEWRHLVNFLS